MISEVYALDEQLVNSYDSIVKIGIQSKTAGVWGSPVPLNDSNIVSESLEIKQSICDDKELKIGGCIPSQLTLSLIDIDEDLSGKRIVVAVKGRYQGNLYPSTSLYPSGDLYPNICQTDEYTLFVGMIDSCKRTNNRRIRKLIAFDRMYYASTVMCKNRVYNFLRQADQYSFTFGEFISNFYARARIQPPSSSYFINYNTNLDAADTFWQKIADKKISFLELFKWLCELNGIFLIEDTPTNITSDRAYPRAILPFNNMNQVYEISSYAINGFQYEDFVTKEIRYVQFDFSDNKWARLRENPYTGYSSYYSDNPLTRSIKSSSNILAIINNLGDSNSSDHVNKIIGDVYQYRPFKASIFNRWWVQVGDRIKFYTDDSEVPIVESIVLSRKLKGIHGLSVEIEAKGVEIMGKENDEEINE